MNLCIYVFIYSFTYTVMNQCIYIFIYLNSYEFMYLCCGGLYIYIHLYVYVWMRVPPFAAGYPGASPSTPVSHCLGKAPPRQFVVGNRAIACIWGSLHPITKYLYMKPVSSTDRLRKMFNKHNDMLFFCFFLTFTNKTNCCFFLFVSPGGTQNQPKSCPRRYPRWPQKGSWETSWEVPITVKKPFWPNIETSLNMTTYKL